MTDGAEPGPRVVLVATDLMTAARIESHVTAARGSFRRVNSPDQLPNDEPVDMVLVDWSERRSGWAESLRRIREKNSPNPPRIILFGPHTDLAAHAAASKTGLGPMLARSALYGSLDRLLEARTP